MRNAIKLRCAPATSHSSAQHDASLSQGARKAVGDIDNRQKPSEDNTEAILEELASSITAREGRLLELRATERTAKHSATLYGLTLWVAYLGVWWTGVFGQGFKVTIPAILLPVLLYAAHRGLSWWFRRLEAREELALKDLRKKQRDELEKLKKKTKFDETRSLLERYDEKAKAKDRMPGAFGSPPSSQSGSPVSRRGVAAPGGPNSSTPIKQAASANTSVMSPGSRGWADRFADALLGENEPQSKYALICGQCHQHNGLVLREELATLQYVCPRCGHLNPPKTAAVQHDSPDALPPPGMRIRTRSAGNATAHRMRHSLTGAEVAQNLRPHSMYETNAGARLPSPLSNGVNAETESSATTDLNAHERALRAAADLSTDETFEDEEDDADAGRAMDLS